MRHNLAPSEDRIARISGGNYDGNVGPFHVHLHKFFADNSRLTLGFASAPVLRYDGIRNVERTTLPRSDMEPNDPLPPDVPPTDGVLDRPSYSEDGIDLTLIRWMLSLTPVERLKVLQQHNRAIARLRDANSNL